MTKLLTHIPPEYVKQNKKLQEIIFRETIRSDRIFTGLTIADIIDSAEMLFPKRLIQTGDNTHCHNPLLIPQTIIHMCQQDKSIEEISKYIIYKIK